MRTREGLRSEFVVQRCLLRELVPSHGRSRYLPNAVLQASARNSCTFDHRACAYAADTRAHLPANASTGDSCSDTVSTGDSDTSAWDMRPEEGNPSSVDPGCRHFHRQWAPRSGVRLALAGPSRWLWGNTRCAAVGVVGSALCHKRLPTQDSLCGSPQQVSDESGTAAYSHSLDPPPESPKPTPVEQ